MKGNWRIEKRYLNLTIPNLVPSGTSYLIQRRAESYILPMRFCIKNHFFLFKTSGIIIKWKCDYRPTYTSCHTSRNIGNKNITSCITSDDIETWCSVSNTRSWIVIIANEILMIRYDRPNTAVVTQGILLVGRFGVVCSVITEKIRLCNKLYIYKYLRQIITLRNRDSR